MTSKAAFHRRGCVRVTPAAVASGIGKTYNGKILPFLLDKKPIAAVGSGKGAAARVWRCSPVPVLFQQ